MTLTKMSATHRFGGVDIGRADLRFLSDIVQIPND